MMRWWRRKRREAPTVPTVDTDPWRIGYRYRSVFDAAQIVQPYQNHAEREAGPRRRERRA